ncbi:MAG: type IV secretory system conjugative DNA transfer family protein [Pyrinomonadaceae bacterium]
MADRHTLLNKFSPERLAEAFYDFEQRGRGWDVSSGRVPLEPPLPAIKQSIVRMPIQDNARRPTVWSGLKSRARRRLTTDQAAESHQRAKAERPVFKDSGELIELQIALPPQLKISPDTAEQFLLNLTFCAFPTSLEVIGFSHYVKVQFTCRKTDRCQLEQQLLAHFPEVVLAEAPDTLADQWSARKDHTPVVIEFGLASECVQPLATFRSFEPDPLLAAVGALSKLQTGEVGILQILFHATRQSWAEHIIRAVTNAEGKPLFADAPEVTALAKQKAARPLFAAVIRVAARCNSHDRAWRVARSLGASLRRFANPASNELIALSNDDYPLHEHERDLLDRATHRSGLIINSEELAGLVHIPSASVRSEKLQRDAKKTMPAPVIAMGHQLILGHNTHRGQTKEVTLSSEQRMRHAFIAGATGCGKTTLLKSMAAQDIRDGDGCCVIDPHSDFINDLLAQVPEERYSDVIVFDPADQHPIPFNVLSAHSDLEKNLLASDLTSIFRRQCTSWGDQLNAVLTNAILAFLNSEQGGTLADLRRFLVEAEYRKAFLQTVNDEELIYYWSKEFPLLRGHPQAPILTRLNAFLRPKPIRAMVSQQNGSLDLRSVIDNKKIFFVKLGQGAIGVENAHLLGSLVLSKLHQVALTRQDVDESQRTRVNIYVDECQYFLNSSVTALLSGGRKHGIGIVLATQEAFALWNSDKEVASAVLTNPYARICFRLGDIDAKKLEDGFSHFDANDLQNLGVGEAIVRLERNDYDFNLKTLPPPKIDPEQARVRRAQITELSRKQYGRKPEEPRMQVIASTATQTAPLPKPALRTDENQVTLQPQSPTMGVQNEQPRMTEVTPPPLGRGGHEHKYLQHLIKRLAEDQGFCITIEQPVLGGTGSIDVALEKGSRKIACEISVTSTAEYELGNIEKCLAAGYDPVIVVSSNKKALTKIRKRVQDMLNAESLERVLLIQPDELPSLLEHYAQEDPATEATVKGYKVKVKRKALIGEDAAIRKAAISKVLLKSLHRLRQDDV